MRFLTYGNLFTFRLRRKFAVESGRPNSQPYASRSRYSPRTVRSHRRDRRRRYVQRLASASFTQLSERWLTLLRGAAANGNDDMRNLTRAIAAIISCLVVTSTSAGQGLPKVALLSTGGTIASRTDPAKGGYVPALSADDLIAAVPAIKKVAQIQAQQISNISSSDMTPQMWLQLSTRINDLLSRADIAGAVVTHGTNTLEETAYFLDLTVTSSKPVVVVGAQRPASDLDADGPRNLLDAIRRGML
jgi:hypothetical protein